MLNKRDVMEWKRGIEDTLNLGLSSAEQMHKAIAEAPLAFLESVEPIKEQVMGIREYQNKAITGFYIFLRDVNQRASQLSDNLISQLPE